MIFLGLGTSRHLVGLYDELATTLGLRLVCVDRWGIGQTDSVALEARTILGWSLIVEQVAEYLAIDRFSVLAHSAGAPFAAAVALLFPERISGPLHLLAPWTGMQLDSSYRWLRYVPDSVIKTAQVADWMIQGWKLGKEAAWTASKTPASSVADDVSESGRYKLDDSDRGPTPPPKDRAVTPGARHAAQTRAGAVKPQLARGEERDLATRKAGEISRSEAASYERPRSTDSERETALDLLKASHAESARGLVDDLNLVLGKRPWGFDYADVDKTCEVWHGSKDERIPLTSSINLTKEMRMCTLHVVDGATHSLMTNTKVVMEVFESIRRYGRS
ncbi:hypothetical protein PHBOTO_000588 [Pseudozyma hubeiensis]|nr:hypothetical protein PHBOTO_000588 [Pseudozyma hubeiensis]